MTALNTALLSQYRNSHEFMERFLSAIHETGSEIERSPNNKKIKLCDQTELDADALDYFIDNKAAMGAEFVDELTEKIGATATNSFCAAIAEDWYAGNPLRNSPRMRRIKRGVRDYLETLLRDPARLSEVVMTDDLLTEEISTLGRDAIASILTVNAQMMHRHLDAWTDCHPSSESITRDSIFLRRGLALQKELDASVPYREWDFINSYSLAFSATEQFAQMTRGIYPAIVNGNINLYSQRILFFSPFIPGMDVGQIEAGVVPDEKPWPIKSQGVHGGIHEYIVDPTPFDR